MPAARIHRDHEKRTTGGLSLLPKLPPGPFVALTLQAFDKSDTLWITRYTKATFCGWLSGTALGAGHGDRDVAGHGEYLQGAVPAISVGSPRDRKARRSLVHVQPTRAAPHDLPIDRKADSGLQELK